MAFPAPTLYPEQFQKLSRLCDALGYPARIELLRLLNSRSMYVKELVRRMPISQAAVSDHLRKLRRSGLIDVRVHGLYNKYSFDICQLEHVRDQIDLLIGELRDGRSEGSAADGTGESRHG